MCCSEKDKPYTDTQTYNLKNLTVGQWYNSAPMQSVRHQIHSDQQLPQCRGCYREEAHGYESRRIRENFKSVIFTEQSFERSYQQSPMHSAFEHSVSNGTTDRLPIDWHVDLGNECNLACKMCEPRASSTISQKYVKWGLIKETANANWTQDEASWENFKTSVQSVPNINRIHFMGGEPLLNKRFPELLKFFLEIGMQSTSISFVTNGTIIKPDVIELLKQFRSCDIEVSLESIHHNNHYIRQMSSTDRVIANILQLKAMQTDTFKIVLRSVPQLLNVNNYDQYLTWAWNNQLPVQGIPLIHPDYLQISVLPKALRQQFKTQYVKLINELESHKSNISTLAVGRNVGNLEQMLIRECNSVISMLDADEPANVTELRQQLCEWMTRWDKEYDYDAREFYPEYAEFFKSIGYNV